MLNLHGAKVPVAPIEQQMRQLLDIEDLCLFQGVDAAGVEELVVAIEPMIRPLRFVVCRSPWNWALPNGIARPLDVKSQ